MTKDEFEKQWAKGSGMTLEQLAAVGLVAVPCDCGDEGCLGWQITVGELGGLSQTLEAAE